jgi:putative oxidoreductase
MLMWTIDKFVRPAHASSVFEHFYGLAGVGPQIIFGLAIAELLLLIAFVLGLWRRWTYGAVLLLHALSTFS